MSQDTGASANADRAFAASPSSPVGSGPSGLQSHCAATIELQPTHETGEVGNSGLRYNIQMARRSDGVWYQRHIWHRDQLGEHNPPRVEAWIRSVQSGPETHMRMVAA